MSKQKQVWELFLQFLKFGCFTFGGGWSIIAQMQKVYVERRKDMTEEDLLDIATVGRSLPGVMIGNISVLFGYRRAGVWGSFACLFGLALPPLAILAVITLFYTTFRDSYWVAAAMSGIRAAVVPIILSAAFPMMRTTFTRGIAVVLAAISFVLYLHFGVSILWLVAGGAVCGLVVTRLEKKGGKAR